MTQAVCFQCGEIKWGAFVPCHQCSAMPQTEDELALSLSMTDHYFDLKTLKQIGQSIKHGKPPQLDPENRAHLIESIRSSGLLSQLGDLDSASNSPATNGHHPPPKKPWWRFW